MNLHHFRDVVAICGAGRSSRGGVHLGVAQPPRSRVRCPTSNANSEAPLFERRSKGMTVTALGGAFVKRAAAITETMFAGPGTSSNNCAAIRSAR